MGLFSAFFKRNKSNKLIDAINRKAFLVDVRTEQEFASGSIPGAVNIPLRKIQNQLSRFKSKENILVFCQSGGRSAQAKYILEQNGFQNVINGGSWKNVNQVIHQNKKI